MKKFQTDYGVIKVSGADAADFLQGQLSNDIHLLNPEKGQISAYHNPKGRVIAILFIIQQGEDYYLILPQERLPAVQKRLQLFIMRAKVKLDALDLAVYGALGERETGQVWQQDGCTWLQLPQSLQLGMGQLNEDLLPSSDWYLQQIKAGLPTVWNATAEAFVAQMLNLDWLGGISFNKGCYTGQEVIARMRYLGQLKRRLYIADFKSDVEPQAGDLLHCPDHQSAQWAGKIVDVRPDGDLYRALIVAVIQLVEDGAPFDFKGYPVHIKAVPYRVQED